MGKGKIRTYIVVPSDPILSKRLISGTLRQVESKLRGEYDVRPATAEEAHGMADVEIEDCDGEPVA